MHSSQLQYDLATPDTQDHFLDTTEGQNWLDTAADDCIDGSLYIANMRCQLPTIELEDKIVAHCTATYNAGNDSDGALGQVLRNVLAGKLAEAQGALKLLISMDEVKEMARDLVRPLADEYVSYMSSEQ